MTAIQSEFFVSSDFPIPALTGPVKKQRGWSLGSRAFSLNIPASHSVRELLQLSIYQLNHARLTADNLSYCRRSGRSNEVAVRANCIKRAAKTAFYLSVVYFLAALLRLKGGVS